MLKVSYFAVFFLVAAFTALPAISADSHCVPVGTWMVPAGAKLDVKDVITRAAESSVVLLGEIHDSAEHHRWQLQMLAGLHAIRPDMVIGLEMFPRSTQKALDRWVSGELSEAEFLKAVNWDTVWRFDPGLYLPIFNFARMNRVPMVAINIGDELRGAVRKNGFDGVPEAEREGLVRPAALKKDYVERLLEVFREHETDGKKHSVADRDGAEFKRFIEMQALWDGAMAQGLAAAVRRPGHPLVVGIMGRGHLVHGDGVPHQLKALGVSDVTTFFPWDHDGDCKELVAGLADAVFGVKAPPQAKARRQLLGIRIELKDDAVHVVAVQKGSVAEAADMRVGDVISEIAGQPVKRNVDVITAVQRQAPGTWLPITIKRAGESVQLVARFAPRKP